MLIGLVSDTHIDSSGESLPPEVAAALYGAELILHAGDIWHPLVLDSLQSVAPVPASLVDDDTTAYIGGDNRVAAWQTLNLEGLTLWLTHIKPQTGLINVDKKVLGENPPQVVVFGHTHHAEIENYRGILFVNPGSQLCPTTFPG